MLTEESILSALLSDKRIDWDCKVTNREGHCARCGQYFHKLEKRARVYTCDERGKYNNDNNIRVLFCRDCLEWFAWIYLNDKRKIMNVG